MSLMADPNKRDKREGNPGKVVHVVHCVDTEGPLYESLQATFERIDQILGIRLDPSYETLRRLQMGKLDLGGKEEIAQEVFSADLLSYLDSWDKIDAMLDEALSARFRQRYSDPEGGCWRFSWFVIDHVDYTTNPRRRDIGYHNIFDHYRSRLTEGDSRLDEVHWHFHPMSTYREAHRCATSFVRTPHVWEVLCRRITDRTWFPTCFRAGFHSERPDSHWFLEQWVPFDFSNQAMGEGEREQAQVDVSGGRLGDWRRAPSEWSFYHPAHDDYQVPGSCNRFIFRCLNVGTRLRLLDQTEVDRAFERAATGEPAVLAFTGHDFRDIRNDVAHVHKLLMTAAARFPEVSWRNCGAKRAAQAVTGGAGEELIDVEVQYSRSASRLQMTVETDRDTFGPQPFLALRTHDRRYLTDNFDFQRPRRRWTYTFDCDSIRPESLDSIGVAVTGRYGSCAVALYGPDGTLRQKVRHA